MGHKSTQILIVNAGGQYCHLISRRLRECGVQPTICEPKDVMAMAAGVKGIIISGGPSSVYSTDAPPIPKEMFGLPIPILGICYGHQAMADALGGKVEPGTKHEYGEAQIQIKEGAGLFKGIASPQTVWMSHGDSVQAVPPGFIELAETSNCRVAAMRSFENNRFGVQFHPEVAHTPCGTQLLRNFVFEICGCSEDWKIDDIVTTLKARIRAEVGGRHVLFFVSGGVDSTVAFTLCTAALGEEQVTGIFVDTGLMRKKEREQIQRIFDAKGWHNIQYLSEEARFLSALNNECNPEQKRRIIGDTFLKIQQDLEPQLGLNSNGWMLGQGTIYPDTVESGQSKKSALIKTHHNRVPAIERMIEQGLVLEPLKEFYKDEVRSLGRAIGLSEELISKNPFPGPGLGVRCLCAEHRSEVSAVVLRPAVKYRLSAVRVPLRTVGVQGDYRTYSDLIILGGKTTLERYSECSKKITAEVRGTNRVAFLVNCDELSALQKAYVNPAVVTKERLDLLREADYIAHRMLDEAGLSPEVWQFPVVLLPLTTGTGETIALRPVSSTDAMTARHADLPLEIIEGMGQAIRKLPGVEFVLYDVTDKPPGTIEWE